MADRDTEKKAVHLALPRPVVITGDGAVFLPDADQSVRDAYDAGIRVLSTETSPFGIAGKRTRIAIFDVDCVLTVGTIGSNNAAAVLWANEKESRRTHPEFVDVPSDAVPALLQLLDECTDAQPSSSLYAKRMAKMAIRKCRMLIASDDE